MSIELILEILVEIQIENQDVSSLNFLFKTPTLLEFLFWKKLSVRSQFAYDSIGVVFLSILRREKYDINWIFKPSQKSKNGEAGLLLCSRCPKRKCRIFIFFTKRDRYCKSKNQWIYLS